MKRARINPEAAPMSEREAMRRDTEAVRAKVVADPQHIGGHTPLVLDIVGAHAWLLRLAEERALSRSPWTA